MVEVEEGIDEFSVYTPTPFSKYHFFKLIRVDRVNWFIVITWIHWTSGFTVRLLNRPIVPIEVSSCQVVASFSIIRVSPGIENVSIVVFREEKLQLVHIGDSPSAVIEVKCRMSH